MTIEELLEAVGELSRQEQVYLRDELTRRLEGQRDGETSVTELRGLGRDVWDGIDAQEYVNHERDSWSG